MAFSVTRKNKYDNNLYVARRINAICSIPFPDCRKVAKLVLQSPMYDGVEFHSSEDFVRAVVDDVSDNPELTEYNSGKSNLRQFVSTDIFGLNGGSSVERTTSGDIQLMFDIKDLVKRYGKDRVQRAIAAHDTLCSK